MQQAAELLVEDTLIEVREPARGGPEEGRADRRNASEGALVALDRTPATCVRWSGAADLSSRASSTAPSTADQRQPGSAFKPFVFAAALEQGWSPASIIDRLDEPMPDAARRVDARRRARDTPTMTLRTALRTSSNRAAVRLLEEVGIPPTVDYAKKLGVGLVPSVPSLALGAGEVTLEGMTAAYTTFASAGVHRTPIFIRRVEDGDGQVIYEAPDDATQVVSEATAFLLSSMLSDVVNYGTAWKAAPCGLRVARRRQDRDDQRLRRCLVCRLHAEAGGRRLDWLRPAADDHRRRLRG